MSNSRNKKPNIVFFLSDQHRYDALGCNGAPVCKTPAMDEIAARGMRFTSAYTSCPLCTPARASILTGLYPHNHGMLANMGNFNGVFDRNLVDKKGYPEYLDALGYRVGYAGKWHLPETGNQALWKLDRWHWNYYGGYLRDKGIEYDLCSDEVQSLEWGADAPFFGESILSAEDNHDYWVADRCIEMIGEYAKTDEPFMISANFHGPHFPIAVPEPYLSMYRPEDAEKWSNFHETFDDKPIVQQKEAMRWNSSHLTWPDWQKIIAAYWGYCSFVDAQIGRVMDELKRRGLCENTILVYASDHGDMLGSHRLYNKGFFMYEECNHIPLIVSWPGVTRPGSVCDSFANLVDLMPTFTEMAGAEAAVPADGRSLAPLLREETPPDWPQEAFVEINGYESTLATMRMIRTKKWKYVYNPMSTDELYDMESDPAEMYNLADRLAFKHVLRRMKDRMLRKLRETGDGIVDVTRCQSNSYDLFISPRER